MAIETTRGTKLVLKVEWTPGSGVYDTACTLNAGRSFERSASMSNEAIPSCDDPDAPAWDGNEKVSLSASFTGDGKLHKSDVKKFEAWHASADPLSCKVILDDDDAANVITRTGNFHLTTYNESGSRGNKVDANISLVADGAVTSTYGANVD